MASKKREDIERAALALFAERGFHGTSMPELAKAAGVGAGTIYRHFENKEAIVNALYQHWKVQLGHEVFEAIPNLPWRARVRELWRSLFAFNAAHPGVIGFLDLHHHSGYLDAQSQAIEMQSALAFFALVMEGQQAEALVDLPPPALIAMVYSAFLGLVRAERENYVTLDPDFIDTTFDRIWAMIRR